MKNTLNTHACSKKMKTHSKTIVLLIALLGFMLAVDLYRSPITTLYNDYQTH